MNNWLQNIKGQITELATEVLNDATEEGQVSTTSELQIEKKKSTECELLYLTEKAKCEALEKKLNELEEQLYSISIEGDAVKEKFVGMVSDRDEIIRRLEREMERIKFNQEHSQEGSFQNIELNSDLTSREGVESMAIQISKLKEKHENEISAILAVHASNVKQLSVDYERRIEQLEAWNALNLTEPISDNHDKLLADFNALKVENDAKNDEIFSLSSQMETKNAQISQLEENLNKLVKEKSEEQHQEIERLRTLNEELIAKMEILENQESVETCKIDSEKKTELALKETETKLEISEQELNKYKNDQIKLDNDLTNLKLDLEETKAKSEENEKALMEEIDSLREVLESTKSEKVDLIVNYNDSMEEMNKELTTLKESNLKLIEENSDLKVTLSDLKNIKLLLNVSEDNFSSLKEKFIKMEEEQFNEIEEIKQERDVLRQQIEEMSEECRRNEEKLLTGSEEFIKPSSDSETSNNADWEKMGKEEIEGVSSSTTTTTSETKDSSSNRGDVKYLRKRKVEILEQSIQTDQSLSSFSSSSQNTELIQLRDELTCLTNKIDKLEEQLAIEEMNKRQILEEKEKLFEELCNKEKEINQLNDEFNCLKNKNEIAEFKENSEDLKLKKILEEKEKINEQMTKLLEENEALKNSFCEEMTNLKIENEQKMENLNKIFDDEKNEFKVKEVYFEEENKKYLSNLSSLNNENLQLKSLLENKHEECQQYYFKLEEFSKNCQNLKQKLEETLNEFKNKEQDLEIKNGKIAKLESELVRLKEHLIVIEEISSKEAIASEERETELRRQLREFKDKFENDESLNTKNLKNYTNELEQLKTNLQFLETEKNDLTSILNEKESCLAETKNALLNLQIVLKDIAGEQKSEKLCFEREIKALKDERKKENEIIKQFQIKEDELKMTKTTNLDKLEYLECQLKIKNDLIDELENQLEEFRILQNKNLINNSSQIITTNNKKIDDSTLKQLFLSFFIAEKSKQPEIAIVMSKILGYNQQEQEQLQKAINSSSYNNNSWFTFGSSPQSFARKEISLTEQFIRFLEQESIDNTRSMLALPENSPPGRAFLLEESTLSTTSLRSSSSTDLKSILDS